MRQGESGQGQIFLQTEPIYGSSYGYTRRSSGAALEICAFRLIKESEEKSDQWHMSWDINI